MLHVRAAALRGKKCFAAPSCGVRLVGVVGTLTRVSGYRFRQASGPLLSRVLLPQRNRVARLLGLGLGLGRARVAMREAHRLEQECDEEAVEPDLYRPQDVHEARLIGVNEVPGRKQDAFLRALRCARRGAAERGQGGASAHSCGTALTAATRTRRSSGSASSLVQRQRQSPHAVIIPPSARPKAVPTGPAGER